MWRSRHRDLESSYRREKKSHRFRQRQREVRLGRRLDDDFREEGSIKSNWEALDNYGREVATPALVAFQKRHGVKLTLLNVGNFDEAQVDLCDFAEKGMFLILPSHGKNIVVPFEQCPHFTIKSQVGLHRQAAHGVHAHQDRQRMRPRHTPTTASCCRARGSQKWSKTNN